MNTNAKKILFIFLSFILGILFITTALIHYGPIFKQCYQLTFLSNLISGVFLIITGILAIFNKKINPVLYLDFTVLLLLVLIVSTMIENAYTGLLLFLHAVNPILFLLYYFIFINQTSTKWKCIFTVLIIPFIYLIFAMIFGSLTGNYIYTFLDFKVFGITNTILILLSMLLGLPTLSLGMLYLNKFIRKKPNKKHSTN